MVVEILTADLRAAMSVRIITPAEYSGVGEIFRKEIAEPVDAIIRRPCLFTVTVQAMDGDDAEFRISSAVKWHGRRRSKSHCTYSITGLVPSATVSRPWGTGPARSGDAKRGGEAWLNN
jgi:hypothetical protein